MSQSGTYVLCLFCKRVVRVNLRGRLRTHVTAPQPALLTICEGSQQPPMAVLAPSGLAVSAASTEPASGPLSDSAGTVRRGRLGASGAAS